MAGKTEFPASGSDCKLTMSKLQRSAAATQQTQPPNALKRNRHQDPASHAAAASPR